MLDKYHTRDKDVSLGNDDISPTGGGRSIAERLLTEFTLNSVEGFKMPNRLLSCYFEAGSRIKIHDEGSEPLHDYLVASKVQ